MREHRVLVNETPEHLEDKLWNIHCKEVSGTSDTAYKAIVAVRELADLRAKVKALDPYIQHKEDCPFIEDMTNGDRVLAKGQPCTCGLVELQDRFAPPVMRVFSTQQMDLRKG